MVFHTNRKRGASKPLLPLLTAAVALALLPLALASSFRPQCRSFDKNCTKCIVKHSAAKLTAKSSFRGCEYDLATSICFEPGPKAEHAAKYPALLKTRDNIRKVCQEDAVVEASRTLTIAMQQRRLLIPQMDTFCGKLVSSMLAGQPEVQQGTDLCEMWLPDVSIRYNRESHEGIAEATKRCQSGAQSATLEVSQTFRVIQNQALDDFVLTLLDMDWVHPAWLPRSDDGHTELDRKIGIYDWERPLTRRTEPPVLQYSQTYEEQSNEIKVKFEVNLSLLLVEDAAVTNYCASN